MSSKRATIRIELHGHSTASDGSLRPEALADQLADSGVVVAALTDHDTVEGLTAFREALARRGVAFLSGLEATVAFGEEEIHLLAWGFDPAHPGVVEAWGTHPPSAEHGNGSLADALRRLERAPGGAGKHSDGPARAGSTRISAETAIQLLHRAGGRVFLAHPFTLRPDVASLRPILERLKLLGLDGLEALYAGYSSSRQAELVDLARQLGLAVSAGSDVHGPEEDERLGVELPVGAWRAFRSLLQAPEPGSSDAPSEPAPAPARRMEWRHFALHILGPTLLALALSVAAVFGVLLPSFERSLLDRKRETIRELVASAWSLLAELEAGEREGRYDRRQAQDLARARIAALRYGREGKDYFWLQDMHPRIVMHPYRRDLEGQDVSDFRDPRGARIFVEFAQVVRRQQEGYVEYVWQWKDDPRRMAAKESYVRGFAPWGWVIGTGIYLDDVRAEISRIERNIFWVSIGIAALVALLLGYVMRQSLGLERERTRAEEGLRESTRRYRTLVEAATEGNLLVLDGRLRYANPVLLKLLGYSAAELELYALDDILPLGEGNEQAWSNVERANTGEEVAGSVDGALLGRDGRLLECVLSMSAITFAGERGFILNVREVATRTARSRPGGGAADASAGELEVIARSVPVGLFRARFARRGAILETNPAAGAMLDSIRDAAEDGPRTLSALLADDRDLDRLREELLAGGVARRVVHAANPDGRARAFALTAHLVRSEAGDPAFVDAVLEDVTARVRQDVERDTMLERLRSSLAFLDEPVRGVVHAVPACLPDTTVVAAAELLAGSSTAALLVQSEKGEALGLVTDLEIRRGLPEALRDTRAPVRRVMSAPLHTLLDDAPVYEALQAMEENRVKHLVVENADRQVVGVVDGATLLQFQSYGALVLAREIARAGSVEEIARLCRRTAGLVAMLLRCGAAPRHLTRMIASVSDATGERLVSLAVAELGAPPCDFAFVALGSQARHEQTLATDQDNAIVFASPQGADEDVLRRYFTDLGRRVCGWLDQAGYRACKGDVMASNPAWCLSLDAWKETFRRWIRESTPRQLVELSIFFDLRAVAGNPALVAELRRDIHATVSANPDFLPRLAQSSLEFRPPVRLFGRILPGGAGGEHLGRLDLKDASHPISTFARVFALRHGLQESSTPGRLQALVESEVLSSTTGDDVTGAFDLMMRLRIRHQVSQTLADQKPDNVVPLSRLSATELTLLKQGFAAIEAVQSKTRFELLGGTG
jgi:PAS domain S-box-containing protein